MFSKVVNASERVKCCNMPLLGVEMRSFPPLPFPHYAFQMVGNNPMPCDQMVICAEQIKFCWLMGSVGGWVFVVDVTREVEA